MRETVLGITIGLILVAFVPTAIIVTEWGFAHAWMWSFGVAVVLAVLGMLIALLVPHD